MDGEINNVCEEETGAIKAIVEGIHLRNGSEL